MITRRTLDRAWFARLGVTDKLRAVLLLRLKPTTAGELKHLSGVAHVAASLAPDIRAGRVERVRPGEYALTRLGREVFANELPIGLMSVRRMEETP